MQAFHRKIVVRGRVQGVGFRASAIGEAARLGISCSARNLQDGTVEMHVEGASELINAFTEWAGRGPILAIVKELQLTDGPLHGMNGQRIIR